MACDDWLSQLYQTHKHLLVFVAWNVLNDRDAAEDAVHTAIVRLAQLSARPDDPRAFAMKTVRNVAIDMARKQRRGREEPWEETSNFEQPPTSEANSLDERLLLVHNALLQMEPNDCEVIRLHLQAGLTFQQIADTLEMPLQTIASRYRRAIAKLRSMIEVKS
jgi:RNA polymerase sigma-70 factor (ECF subfamily)